MHDLSVTYRAAGRRGDGVRAVRGVDLTVRRGGTVGLVGESGSGKSIIGSAILGPVPAPGGRPAFDGTDITRGRRRAGCRPGRG